LAIVDLNTRVDAKIEKEKKKKKRRGEKRKKKERC